MFTRMEIEPVDIEPYKCLAFQEAYHKDFDLVKRYVEAGHNPSRMKVYNCFEHHGLPESALEIRDRFNWLQQKAVAVNLLMPGDYLPLHFDLYQAYQRTKNIKDKPIERWIVMLQGSVQGQLIQIGDDVCGKWRAGDCFGWRGDDLHAAYNFSFEPRYVLQITGVFT